MLSDNPVSWSLFTTRKARSPFCTTPTPRPAEEAIFGRPSKALYPISLPSLTFPPLFNSAPAVKSFPFKLCRDRMKLLLRHTCYLGKF